MHSIKTERLLIRPLKLEDKEHYSLLLTNQKVMRHTGGQLSIDEANIAFDRSMKANRNAMDKKKYSLMTWTIVDYKTMDFIGIQSLSFLNRPHNKEIMEQAKASKIKQAEIGIMLTPIANGKLYPEEAMTALIEYAFTKLSLAQINAHYSINNRATPRFTKKIGFTQNLNKSAVQKKIITETVYKNNWQGEYIISIDEEQIGTH